MKLLALLLLLSTSNAATTDACGMCNYGEQMYKTYCAGCHGLDGKGKHGHAANFVDDKSRLAKSNEELANSILNGRGSMPSYKWMFSKEEVLKIVEYIRETFGNQET